MLSEKPPLWVAAALTLAGCRLVACPQEEKVALADDPEPSPDALAAEHENGGGPQWF
jgi:hypothetical protein